MLQIGPLKYVKEDERTIMASILIGAVFGIPSGLLLSYLTGFLINPKFDLGDYFGWTIFFLRVGFVLVATCWAIAIGVCMVSCRKRSKDEPPRQTSRIVLGTVFLPLTITYTLLVLGLVNTSIDALLQRFGFSHTYAVSVLVSIPFLLVYVAVFIPDSPIGKALRRFLHPAKRSKRQRARA